MTTGFTGKTVSLILLSFFALMITSSGLAQEEDMISPNISDIEASNSIDLEQFQEVFNENSERVPGFASSLIGDQTVHVNLTDVELENSSIGFRMDGMEVSDVQWGEYNDTTLEITVTRENLEKLLSSDNPAVEVSTMLENRDIQYSANTFGNKVKLGLFRFFAGF